MAAGGILIVLGIVSGLLALGVGMAALASVRISRAEAEDAYDAEPWGDQVNVPFSGDPSIWMGR